MCLHISIYLRTEQLTRQTVKADALLIKQGPTRHWPIAHWILNNSFCVMRESWGSHETVMRQSWDSHDTVMRHSWYSHETAYYSTPVVDLADMFVLVCSWDTDWSPEWVATWPWPDYRRGHGKNGFHLVQSGVGQLVTEVFVEQPRLHWVYSLCRKYYVWMKWYFY